MVSCEYRVSGPRAVALETTVLTHGLPRELAPSLIGRLREACTSVGTAAAFCGVVGGRAIVGLTDAELDGLIASPDVRKVNTSNLGLVMHSGGHGATTVGTTLELAAGAGIRVAATGGIGGVHRGYADRLDISADLGVLTRYPLALVCSGAKNILDVGSTRELLETLGIPLVGYRTDAWPAFLVEASEERCDGRFDEVRELAAFLGFETRRTGRGVLVGNPVPAEVAIPEVDMPVVPIGHGGRSATPNALRSVQDALGERAIRANTELLISNARLAAAIAMGGTETGP